MRNYVRLFCQRADFTGGVAKLTSLPFVGINLLQSYGQVSNTVEGLETFRTDATNIAIANGNGVTFTDVEQRFFTLDAANLSDCLNSCALLSLPTAYGPETDTPRYTGWTDTKGADRLPAPTDKKGAKRSGKASVVDLEQQIELAILTLQTRATRERGAARARDLLLAGRLLNLLNRLIAGKITPTDALALFEKLIT